MPNPWTPLEFAKQIQGVTATKKGLNLILLSTLLTTSSCTTALDKLENVGKKPEMTKIENPVLQRGYKPMTWPLPKPIEGGVREANSLWQPGARAFFRDQRASRVGDILRVQIAINEKAELDNATERKRDGKESLGAPNVFGLEGILLPGKVNPDKMFSITGKTDSKGEGSIKRKEKIETQVAALITQVLPNGNFVIQGSQEIRINYEKRNVSISGVIRPEDIDMDNTIDSSQIAEARIIYGGDGQISDAQQPRWGHQVIDILSPF